MNDCDLFYSIAQSARAEQVRYNKELELRAVGTLGIAATMVVVAALVMKDSPVEGLSGLPTVCCFFAGELGLSFCLTAFFSIWTLWPRHWERRPEPTDLARHLRLEVRAGLVEWAAESVIKSLDANKKIIHEKQGASKWGLLCGCWQALMLILLTISTKI